MLEREILDLIEPGKKVSIERDVWPKLIGNGLYGYPGERYWIDIGTPGGGFLVGLIRHRRRPDARGPRRAGGC